MICFAGGELLSRYGVLLGLGLLEELACAISNMTRRGTVPDLNA